MNGDPMINFCETCFKNPHNPSTIDLVLTNTPRGFQHITTVETGLSDHHKLAITVLKSFSQKPITIAYRDYKNFKQPRFRNELLKEICNLPKGKINYETSEDIVVRILNIYAHIKESYVRANNSPFMNKTLSKAIMTRSRLCNRFIKNPSPQNKTNYTKFRNYCTGLSTKEKHPIIITWT